MSGACAPYVVCPAALEATFASLQAEVFDASCGTSGSACHSSTGGVYSGGLDLADDPYTALLGADGRGAPAENIAGSATKLRRVVPGDPDHSFLVLKLTTKTTSDPRYGHGMPYPSPGSICPAALAQLRSWIESGAKP